MKKTILAFGEVLWDILPSGMVLGGAPFNFAYRANSLGDTGLMISRLGRDELGYEACDQIVQLGLDTRFIQWDDKFPTGTVQVSFDQHNNPDYFITPNVAYDQIELTEELLEAVSTADCLCFGTLSQRSGKSRKTVKELLENADRSLKFLDINLRKKCYSLETVTFSLQKADVLKLNEEEAHQLGDMLGIKHGSLPEFCQEVSSKWSLKYCLVTLGESGAFAFSNDGQKIHIPGYKVSLVDSLGSGDAFSAGFVHKLLQDASIAEACKFGNILGALVAAKEGATSLVTLDEIESFCNRDCKRIVHPALKAFTNI